MSESVSVDVDVDVDDSLGNTKMFRTGLRSDSRRKEEGCLLYTSPSPRDRTRSRMPSSA